MVGSPAVLLVFLALGLEGVPTLASSQYCPISSDVVVPAGNVVPVYHEEISGAKNMSAALFLQPLSSFEGISVEASYEKYSLAAWFPTDSCCSGIDHSFTWIQLKVEVETEYHYYYLGYYFHYMLNFGGCVKKCVRRWGFTLNWDVGNLKIVAHGSSRWKCGSPPDACLTSCDITLPTTSTTCLEPTTNLFVNSSSHSSPCNGTPTPATAPTPTSTPATQPTLLVAVLSPVLVAMGVVLIVVLVSLFCKMRRRRVLMRSRHRPASFSSPSSQQHQSHVHVSMNSLYESVSGLSASHHLQRTSL